MSLLSRLAVQAARAYGILSPKGGVSASYLVVAGGGGSTANGVGNNGGGGAGGFRSGTSTLSILNTYTVVVGAGGGTTANGVDSSLSGTGLTTITSTGGGYGALYGVNGASGGSGGGAGQTQGLTLTGGAGNTPSTSPSQGNNGGSPTSTTLSIGACGGGGASAVGANCTSAVGGAGGAGSANPITGSTSGQLSGGIYYFSGGGGGASHSASAVIPAGGVGGGGNGKGNSNGTAATSGTANTGGGAGGVGENIGSNTSGGSGIVIISYTSATPLFVGGTLTTSGGNQIHTFTSSGTLSPLTPVTVSYLVVAGGGSGGSSDGGGGGAGGLLTSSTTIYSGATYVVTVGAGGAARSAGGIGNSGSNSSLAGTGLTTVTSTGGGGGGYTSATGASGGSGGGSSYGQASGGTGTSGQGNNGGGALTGVPYYGMSGGGGAGAVGVNGTNSAGGAGGAGSASSISGSSVTYAGGGGGAQGGSLNNAALGAGGTGGGGAAGNSNIPATAGTVNLGGGGGGGGFSVISGAGGSGTVIISYAGSQVFNGGLVTSSGGNTIHTFNATGALTPLTNNLNNSLRFRGSNSNYLSRTPALATNRTTWTWSAWVKRGTISSATSTYTLFGCTTGATDSTFLRVCFYTDKIIVGNNSAFFLQSTQLFRDPSAWYHIVVAADTTQGTVANRLRIYVNGNEITSWSTDSRSTYLTSSVSLAMNQATQHSIGSSLPNAGDYFDGYMTDINFVDGQQLEPYYFGNNDAYGNWKPIKYTGMYGTNGYYLTFGNTASTTTLGYDSSPNGNNWTCNNISLTAGTTYDAMLDVPTNTSATVANYCVLNPLEANPAVTVAQGNLSYTSSNDRIVKATMSVTSGKWYWEFTAGNGGNPSGCGAINPSVNIYAAVNLNVATAGVSYLGNGNKSVNGTATAYGSTFTTSDIIGVALDLTSATNTITFYKNNTSQGAITLTSSLEWCPAFDQNAGTNYVNFGQRPFTYTPPTGFVALNTYNLPTPTILQGNKYMDATLYTGNNTTNVITNAAAFKPDFLWIKTRSAGLYNHHLMNSVTGATKHLISNSTGAEITDTSVTSFNSNGFTLATDATYLETNQNGSTYVGWQWQAGQGTTTAGTGTGGITSVTQSVNTTAGFSIVTFTMPASGTTFTVTHGLGVTPKFVAFKTRSGTSNWLCQHTSTGTQYIMLNSTAVATTDANIWNSAPTSSVVNFGTSFISSYPSNTAVMYCWAEIAGFSKFGSYTGNGSTDGPFVYLGFRPKFIMLKITSTADSWLIIDSVRQTYNVMGPYLIPNLSDAEGTASIIDFTSNGFKLRNTGGSYNGSGSTYIYMAFAENPFKNSNAR